MRKGILAWFATSGAATAAIIAFLLPTIKVDTVTSASFFFTNANRTGWFYPKDNTYTSIFIIGVAKTIPIVYAGSDQGSACGWSQTPSLGGTFSPAVVTVSSYQWTPSSLGSFSSVFKVYKQGEPGTGYSQTFYFRVVEGYDVTPQRVSFDGQTNGPFAPASQTMTVMNQGGSSLDWVAWHTATWFQLSQYSGTLSPQVNNDVYITLTAEANNTPTGITSWVIFQNTTSGKSFTNTVALQVYPTKTWDAGGGAVSNWSWADNWVGDTVPVAGDPVTIGVGGYAAILDTPATVGMLLFNRTGNFTVANYFGNALTIGAGGIVAGESTGTRTYSIEAPIVLGANQTWSNTPSANENIDVGSCTFGGNRLTIAMAANGPYTRFNQALAGGDVTFSGGSMVVASGIARADGGTGPRNIVVDNTFVFTVTNGAMLQMVPGVALDSLAGTFHVGGTLFLNGGLHTLIDGFKLDGSGIVSGSASTTLTFEFATQNTILSNNLVGGLAITKRNGTTVTLTGRSTYTGATTVEEGTLLANGVQAGAGGVVVGTAGVLGGIGSLAGATTIYGTNAPGANGAGTLTISNTVAFSTASNSVALMQINVPGNDKLKATGAMTLGGALVVTNFGAEPNAGDVFDVFDASSFAGTFASIRLPSLSAGKMWSTNRLYTAGELVVALIPYVDVTNTAATVSGEVTSIVIEGSNNVAVVGLRWTNSLGVGGPVSVGGPWWSATVPLGVGPNFITVIGTNFAGDASSDSVTIQRLLPQADGVWINPAGGSWMVAGNWTNNTVANGTDKLADFSTLNPTVHPTVNVASNWMSIGHLRFDDTVPSHNWTVTAGNGTSLLFATSLGPTTVDVRRCTATISASVAGSNGLFKTGPGTLMLLGTNALAGPTTVDAGTLIMGGMNTGDSVVSVGPSAIFGGAGLVASSVTVAGTNAPGVNGVGTMICSSNFTMLAGSVYEWQVSSNRIADRVEVGNVLDLSSGTVTVHIVDVGAVKPEDTNIVFAFGSLVGTESNLVLSCVDTVTNGVLFLDGTSIKITRLSQIPEPVALAALVLGLACMIRRARGCR